MSINDSVKTAKYGITIDVPDHIVEGLISKGHKPQEILSRYFERLAKEEDIEYIITYSMGHKTKKKQTPQMSAQVDSQPTKDWTSELFDEYMNLLVMKAKHMENVRDMISLLIAYKDTEPRPSSEVLREVRGFEYSDKWYEELRIAKSGLTIIAKHMGLPSYFLRAYGSSLKRKHPIREDIFENISQWFTIHPDVEEKYRRHPNPRMVK